MASQLVPAASPVGDDIHFRVDSDVRGLAVSEHHVWLAHHDGDVSIRKTRTTELVRTFTPTGGRVWSLVVVPYSGGKADQVWVGLHNGDIDVYDANTVERLHHLHRHTGGIYAMTEYGGYVFSGSNDFTVCVWSAERYRCVKQLCGHSSYVRCLYAEGSMVISGSDDQTLRVWEVPSGAVLHVSHIHQAGVSAMARVGMHMWSGDDTGNVCMWALGTYELLTRNDKAHASRITVIKKVGSRVYIGSTDRRVSIWDAYGRRHLRTMEDHNSWVTCVACPAELSRYFVWSAGADGAVRCWHHDEYRVMNGDAERYDDVRWYYTTHPPSSEQATALIDQLANVEGHMNHWRNEADARRVESCQRNVEAESLKQRLTTMERDLAAATARSDKAERDLKAVQESEALKDAELKATTAKLLALTTEHGASSLEIVTLRSQAAEAVRRADQAVAERIAGEGLLRKMMEVKSMECRGAPLLVVNTPADEGSAVVSLYRDVQTLLQLNETLRDEVERYKGVLGVKSSTPYPILSLSKLALDRINEPMVVVATKPLPPAAPVVAGGGVASATSVSGIVAVGGPQPPSSTPTPAPPAVAVPIAPPKPAISPMITASVSVSNVLVPTPPPVAPQPQPAAVIATSTTVANAATSTADGGTFVVPSVPLLAIHTIPNNTYEVLHGGAHWANANVSQYVQERYQRKVAPLFGVAAAAASSTPHRHGGGCSPRSVSPRYQQSVTRPATARAFGSSTRRM